MGIAETITSMYESKKEKLLPFHKFLHRIFSSILFALAILAVALGIGILGYHYVAQFSWIDALLNASMILAGMGPVGELPGDAAKIFASCYAIFSGVVFITLIGVILGPVVHRILHKFHWDDNDTK